MKAVKALNVPRATFAEFIYKCLTLDGADGVVVMNPFTSTIPEEPGEFVLLVRTADGVLGAAVYRNDLNTVVVHRNEMLARFAGYVDDFNDRSIVRAEMVPSL